MVRLIVTLFVFEILACGGTDTGQTGGTAPVGASGGERASVPETPEPSRERGRKRKRGRV